MQRSLWILAAVTGLSLVAGSELLARGGRGGGGGGFRGGGGYGGGGMSRPSPSVGRSPSMSRPSPAMQPTARPSVSSRPSPSVGTVRPATGVGAARPPVSGIGSRPSTGVGGARPVTGARPSGVGGVAAGSRPSAGQLNNFLDVPRPGTGAIGAAGGRPGGAAADFLQQGGRPAQLPAGGTARLPGLGTAGGVRPGVGAGAAAGITGRPGAGDRMQNVGDRRQNLSDNRAGRIDNRQEWQQNRQQRVDQVRNQIDNDFNTPIRDFWSDHPAWGAWAITRPFRWATWGALSGWVGYGTAEPYYYNYGDSVYYQDGMVYSQDQPIATAEEYAAQAESIVESAPEQPPQDSEWMTLGVFALTQDGEATGTKPTLYLQLNVSRQGVIAGTFNNTVTGETQTVEGAIDKATQRAAWGVVGKSRPIVECGLSNLTQDSSPALIHFADGQTQQWLLVRLNEPQQQN